MAAEGYGGCETPPPPNTRPHLPLCRLYWLACDPARRATLRGVPEWALSAPLDVLTFLIHEGRADMVASKPMHVIMRALVSRVLACMRVCAPQPSSAGWEGGGVSSHPLAWHGQACHCGRVHGQRQGNVQVRAKTRHSLDTMLSVPFIHSKHASWALAALIRTPSPAVAPPPFCCRCTCWTAQRQCARRCCTTRWSTSCRPASRRSCRTQRCVRACVHGRVAHQRRALTAAGQPHQAHGGGRGGHGPACIRERGGQCTLSALSIAAP